jgi:hypothetical protein
MLVGAGAVVVGLLACGAPPPATTGAAPTAQARVTSDSSSLLVPPGLGTLKQEDIAIILEPAGTNVRVTAIPLDESVIRVLAPDSYRSLRANLESRRQAVAQRAAIHGVREARVWYVRFYGLAPDARFVPTDFTVTSGGREYRPIDVIGLSPRFGEQRLQPRETESGLLLFDEGLDVSQPLTVTMGSEQNTDWEGILRKIDGERASIRARAAA